MKARHLSACLSVVVLSVLCVLTAAARRVKVSQLALADPYILLDGGTYYAYGTHSPRGIEVYSSPDLKVWHYCGLAYDKRDGDGRHHFWAPEVYKVEGHFYMYYTADERLYVARSLSPLGPFRQISRGPMLRSLSTTMGHRILHLSASEGAIAYGWPNSMMTCAVSRRAHCVIA